MQVAGATSAATAAPGGNLLLAGRVLSSDSNGVVPVDDATLSVWWIPGLVDAQPGDELAIQTIATARTRSDGSYAINVLPTQAMKRDAAANGGWLNFDIGTRAPALGKVETTGISRRLVNGAWAVPAPESPAADAANLSAGATIGGDEVPTTPDSRRALADLVLSSSSQDVTTSAAATDDAKMATAEPVEATGVAYCSFIVDARPQRQVNVVEFHNAANSNARWTYGQSADSDIESGVDYSGNGGWSIGATRHIANARSATVYRKYTGGTKANNYGTTDFEFIDGHYQPYGSGSTCYGTTIPVNTKVKNPVEWVAGVGSNTGAGSEYIGCDQTPQWTHHSSYPVGSGFTRNSSSAATIGAAVDIGPINVGAQSGFSTDMDSRWDSKRGHGIWLCGTNYGVTTAGVIHAQNRP